MCHFQPQVIFDFAPLELWFHFSKQFLLTFCPRWGQGKKILKSGNFLLFFNEVLWQKCDFLLRRSNRLIARNIDEICSLQRSDISYFH